MNNIETYDEIKKVLNESTNILIVTHIDPDGDAIGSSLALYNICIKLDKNVDIYMKNPCQTFLYLNSFKSIITDISELNNTYDTLFVLDCSDKKRVEFDIDSYNFKNIVVIDHHATHKEFGTVTLLESDSPATCQIVYDLFKYLNIEMINETIECLYTGLVTDTGCFRYSNITPHTFEIAKEMIKTGINFSYITRIAFDVMSIEKFNLVKICLNNIEIINNKIAYLYLPKSELDKFNNIDSSVHEGLVNYGRNIENIEVSIFIRQTDENEFKASLRSNDYVDVAEIASSLNGGGHLRAAGIVYEGKLEDFKRKIIEKVNEQL